MPLDRALQMMRSCSIVCRPEQRLMLAALTAHQAAEIVPRSTRGRRPPTRDGADSAATLVQHFHEQRPQEAFAPTEVNNYTTPILADALAWLVALGLCEWIAPRTLYKCKPRSASRRRVGRVGF